MTEKTLKRKLGEMEWFNNIQNNQVVFHHKNGSSFYSYETFIGAFLKGQLYLSNMHDYSRTTSKYCGRWCGYDTKTRRKMIKEGRAILVK